VSRRDDHLEYLLRYLGATYYQTLHGDAAARDVAHAVASLDAQQAAGQPGRSPLPRSGQDRRTGRWRVRDVMRTDPVTVQPDTPAAEIARLMSHHRVSAVPVIIGVSTVVGVVSEADLLQSKTDRRQSPGARSQSRDTAADLMTAPAITIQPDAPLAAAARLMHQHQIRLLPVVSPEGELVGVVSRRNLLSIFLRPDKEIAEEVSGVLSDLLLVDPGLAAVSAHDGTVTLTGQVASEEGRAAAVRVAEDVDGVACVIDQLTVAAPAGNPGDGQ
jgi:CBS-domain-containing membrane protein